MCVCARVCVCVRVRECVSFKVKHYTAKPAFETKSYTESPVL